MNFGQAIELLKKGKSIARSGWNGKNMSLCLQKGGIDHTKAPAIMTDVPFLIENIKSSLFEALGENTLTRLPVIVMTTASGSLLFGWLASQTDMLAEDWVEIE